MQDTTHYHNKHHASARKDHHADAVDSGQGGYVAYM
jgi:hypothetical protein